MIDHLVVARTRKHIRGQSDNLTFPEMLPPQNEYLDSLEVDDYSKFEDILFALPKYFAAYKPAVYIEQAETGNNVLENESLRDQFLVVMLNKLLVKRLESSWTAFHSTLKAVKTAKTGCASPQHSALSHPAEEKKKEKIMQTSPAPPFLCWGHSAGRSGRKERNQPPRPHFDCSYST